MQEAPSFEQSLSALEEVVQELEAGKLPLDEALGRYEEGVGYLKSCYKQLSQAERRIELLSGVDAEGNAITEPLADEAGDDLGEKAQNRSRRRSTAIGSPDAGSADGGEGEDADEEEGNDVDDSGRLF